VVHCAARKPFWRAVVRAVDKQTEALGRVLRKLKIHIIFGVGKQRFSAPQKQNFIIKERVLTAAKGLVKTQRQRIFVLPEPSARKRKRNISVLASVFGDTKDYGRHAKAPRQACRKGERTAERKGSAPRDVSAPFALFENGTAVLFNLIMKSW